MTWRCTDTGSCALIPMFWKRYLLGCRPLNAACVVHLTSDNSNMKAPSAPRFVSRLTRDSLALVMAGGRGSRLRQLTLHRAKPAVPFGGKFRIVDFTLSNCVNSGIRRIGVLTQYKSHSLIQHLQMGWGFMRGQFGEFIELLPAEQRSDSSLWYSGTADSVYQNLDFIRAHQPENVLI